MLQNATECDLVGGGQNYQKNNTNTDTISSTATTTTEISNITVPKEKRRWFSSLTRKNDTTTTIDESTLNNNNNISNNNIIINNNELQQLLTTSRKRKDEKNVFQRFRKKIGIRFPVSLRLTHFGGNAHDDNGTTDASAEFLTHSPARKPQLTFSFMQSNNNNNNDNNVMITTTTANSLDETEMIPFTHDYKRFIINKWLENTQKPPNRIMYKACCEMLSQVWYWGEISRRDAQKQLKDKPTGSFLVRDSETSGCQFTLSFRIVNVTLHYRLEYRDNYWHFEELQYESIVEMIEDILYRCKYNNFQCFVPNEVQPPFPVILKYPLSRYMCMPHLQDLCRRVIQQNVSQQQINNLPIPPKLLEYLAQPRELVFQS